MGIFINMVTNCVLCGSDKIKLVQKIPKGRLIELYKNSLGFDVSENLSKSDVKCCKCNSCKLNFFEPDTAGNGQF